MTERIPESLRNRSADRKQAAVNQTRSKKPAPPTAGRILAAAASVASGIGLVGLLSNTTGQQEVVIQVAPTPVVIERVVTNTPQATPTAATSTQAGQTEQFIVVQPAEPVATVIQQQPVQEQPTQQQPEPVAESKGS